MSEAESTGLLSQMLFDKNLSIPGRPIDKPNHSEGSGAAIVSDTMASEYHFQNKFEGVEQYQWYEFEDPALLYAQ